MTDLTKTMKAGYQGKADSMRELANKSIGEMNGGNEKVKKYKNGGSVEKYAMGGVAKIRHNQATNQGLPKNFKKKSSREC